MKYRIYRGRSDEEDVKEKPVKWTSRMDEREGWQQGTECDQRKCLNKLQVIPSEGQDIKDVNF